jgi:hypothetical protein
MKPPRPFKFDRKRGYSLCIACGNWRQSNNLFQHEGTHWILCLLDWVDYWENTDELQPDFKDYVA